MANYNYQTGYPMNLEPNSTDNELTLFQKAKAEFERIYRLLNDGLSHIDQVAESIQDLIDGFDDRVDTAINQIRQMMADLESRVNAMVANALSNYYTKAQVDALITSRLDTMQAQMNNMVKYYSNIRSFTAPYKGVLIHVVQAQSGGDHGTDVVAQHYIVELDAGDSFSALNAGNAVFIKTT